MRTPSKRPWRPSPIKARRGKAFVAALLLLTAGAAAGASSEKSRRADLQGRQADVRRHLESLHRDLGKTEASRAAVSGQLRTTEAAIAATNQRLRTLAAQRQAVQGELRDLENQAWQLDQQIAVQQAQLAQLLYRQYVAGEGDALTLLLAGRDPNTTARDLHFLALLSRAKADLIGDLRNGLAEKQHLSEARRGKAQELADVERGQEQQRAALTDQQRQRQILLAQIADKAEAQRREIESLRRDDERLGKLIAGLSRKPSRHKRKAGAAGNAGEPAAATIESPLPNYDPADAPGAFARLRGRLPAPVRGEVANRFGSPRSGGGTLWKGWFIRAAEGAAVQAIAAGRVVFADSLRGFGNLLIVDHGDDFLSIYGNNQTLLHKTGDQVKAGEPLATVGHSGGNAESGLYFELRHQGRPFDPIRWISLH